MTGRARNSRLSSGVCPAKSATFAGSPLSLAQPWQLTGQKNPSAQFGLAGGRLLAIANRPVFATSRCRSAAMSATPGHRRSGTCDRVCPVVDLARSDSNVRLDGRNHRSQMCEGRELAAAGWPGIDGPAPRGDRASGRPLLNRGHERERRRSVDRLADEIGVAGVARRLLDEVEQHPPHRPCIDIGRRPSGTGRDGDGLVQVCHGRHDRIGLSARPNVVGHDLADADRPRAGADRIATSDGGGPRPLDGGHVSQGRLRC